MLKPGTQVNSKGNIYYYFYSRKNIIPITEAYELAQSLLASEPFSYVARYSSTLVGVFNLLQWSILVTSKNLWINPVWQNWIPTSLNFLISIPKKSDTDSPFECSQLQLGASSLKYSIALSISYCEHIQNRQSSTYTTQITVLYMNRQGYTFIATERQSDKPFHNFFTSGVRLLLENIGFCLPENIITLSYITLEIPGRFNKYWLSTWNICLRKGICEVNTLTLKTYNTLQNLHQTHCCPLDHQRIRVQGFRRQSLLVIPSHTILWLEFTDSQVRFLISLEITCAWNHIVVINWLLWNYLPCVTSHNTLNFIIHDLVVFIRIIPCYFIHIRWSISIVDLRLDNIRLSHMKRRWRIHTIFCIPISYQW